MIDKQIDGNVEAKMIRDIQRNKMQSTPNYMTHP